MLSCNNGPLFGRSFYLVAFVFPGPTTGTCEVGQPDETPLLVRVGTLRWLNQNFHVIAIYYPEPKFIFLCHSSGFFS
jgi:hypothetical protein